MSYADKIISPRLPVSRRCWIAIFGAVLCALPCAAQTANAVIGINTTTATPFPSGFSGFSAPQLRNAAEYFDANFTSMTALLKPGWVRFPGGASDDAYDWNAGQLNAAWTAMFSSVPGIYPLLANSQQLTQAKSGVWLSDFSNFANALAASGIICFNGFTDTNASSAANMALAAQADHLNVTTWELTNEPYLLVPGFWPTATAFASAMSGYASQIRLAVPGSSVSIPFAGLYTGVAASYTAWDNQLAAFSPRYWNGVIVHIYPLVNQSLSVSDTQTFLNGILAHGSADYLNSYFPPLIGNTPIYITEFNLTTNRGQVFQTYLYNGIFLVEYIARLSSVASVKRIGVQALYMGNAYQWGAVRAAHDFEGYLAGSVYPNAVNTSGWPFGFYLSAPGYALAVANQAINNSSNWWATTVTGGATVPISGFDGQPVPAIFAQAYRGDNGKRYLLITNKAATPQTVSLTVNGTPYNGPFNEFYVANNDPTASNTASTPTNVQIQTASSTNTISVPAYCVMRVEW